VCDHCSCRSFGPIADLTREHEEILALAWEIAEGREVSPDALLALLDPHVEKEERGLYPHLLQTGDLPQERLDVLEDEHVGLRFRLTSGTFDRRAYYALASHIEEEEMELFPAAMFAFDDDDWSDLEALAS
jgi:hypothetical protein